MDRTGIAAWIAGYEEAWRSPGTGRLGELFTHDCTYLPSPWSQPVQGVEALARFWESEREGPHEVFTMHSEVVAVDDDTDVAVVRVEVDYARDSSWRDLWIVRFGPDGRCTAFEEWPFAPGQPDGH